MENTNFRTPTYYVKDFGSIEAVKKHLEYKIKAVIKDNEGKWKIEKVKREIYADYAYAIIYMSR